MQPSNSVFLSNPTVSPIMLPSIFIPDQNTSNLNMPSPLSIQNYNNLISMPFSNCYSVNMPNIDQSEPSHTPNVQNSAVYQIVTIRMLMSGKEVGSIIGKRGDNVKKFREQSGARINISDGSCPERIVTVTGTVDRVFTAFLMMCQKFEYDYKIDQQQQLKQQQQQQQQKQNHQQEILDKTNSNETDVNYDQTYHCPPVTLRLLVPATQCGSIIGKGGCKIKDIRDASGASIQVASELLPQSSERTVTVSGSASAVANCIKQIGHILLETPIKYGNILYVPKPSYVPTGPNIQSNNHQMHILPISPQNQMRNHNDLNNGFISPSSAPINLYTINPSITNVLHHGSNIMPTFFPASLHQNNPSYDVLTATSMSPMKPDCHYLTQNQTTLLPLNQSLHTSQMGPGQLPSTISLSTSSLSSTSADATCYSQPLLSPTSIATSNIRELQISNEMIGCIIGRGGATINEIRALSGAQIKICGDTDAGNLERQVIISGTLESINTAQLLINANLQSYKKSMYTNPHPPPMSQASSAQQHPSQPQPSPPATQQHPPSSLIHKEPAHILMSDNDTNVDQSLLMASASLLNMSHVPNTSPITTNTTIVTSSKPYKLNNSHLTSHSRSKLRRSFFSPY